MNADQDLERRVAAFYATEAPPRAPDWVLDGVLATMEVTPQRRAFLHTSWPFPIMGPTSRVAIAAAAVLAIAVLGLAALRPGQAPGMILDPTGSPPDSPSASSAPPSPPAPTRSAEPLPSPIEHVVRNFRSPFTYVLPAGAEFEVGPLSWSFLEVRVPAAAKAGHPAGLIVQAIKGGRTDPCSATSAAKPIVGGANSVIEYLREIPNLEILEESRVVVGREWAFQARVKARPATPNCPDLWLWAEGTDPFSVIPREEVVRVIAVDGPDRLVLTVYGEEANPWWGAMADELMDSFRFLLSESPPRALHPWLGAVRVEPSGAPTLVPVADRGAFLDPRGDGMPEAIDLVDFTWLSINVGCFGGPFCADFRIAETSLWSQFDPSLEWVAYGFMADREGDGVGDVLVGLDNLGWGNRQWQTHLDSGDTIVSRSVAYRLGSVPWLVKGFQDPSEARITGSLGADFPLGFTVRNFYLWAAVAREGRIVSVDYFPDTAWFTLAPP